MYNYSLTYSVFKGNNLDPKCPLFEYIGKGPKYTENLKQVNCIVKLLDYMVLELEVTLEL